MLQKDCQVGCQFTNLPVPVPVPDLLVYCRRTRRMSVPQKFLRLFPRLQKSNLAVSLCRARYLDAKKSHFETLDLGRATFHLSFLARVLKSTRTTARYLCHSVIGTLLVYSLHSVHIKQCTLPAYTSPCALDTVCCTLITAHLSLLTVHCTLYTAQCINVP